jgi:hypothetical protein
MRTLLLLATANVAGARDDQCARPERLDFDGRTRAARIVARSLDSVSRGVHRVLLVRLWGVDGNDGASLACDAEWSALRNGGMNGASLVTLRCDVSDNRELCNRVLEQLPASTPPWWFPTRLLAPVLRHWEWRFAVSEQRRQQRGSHSPFGELSVANALKAHRADVAGVRPRIPTPFAVGGARNFKRWPKRALACTSRVVLFGARGDNAWREFAGRWSSSAIRKWVELHGPRARGGSGGATACSESNAVEVDGAAAIVGIVVLISALALVLVCSMAPPAASTPSARRRANASASASEGAASCENAIASASATAAPLRRAPLKGTELARSEALLAEMLRDGTGVNASTLAAASKTPLLVWPPPCFAQFAPTQPTLLRGKGATSRKRL